jgi:hypothetical protein
MIKGTVLYLSFGDAEVVNRIRKAELEKDGYLVLAFDHFHEAFPVIEESASHGQKFDLIIVEPLTAMICEESRELYERLRQTRFRNLPIISNGPTIEQGKFIVDLLCALIPDAHIMIFTWLSKGTTFGTEMVALFNDNPRVISLCDKSSIGVDEFVRHVSRAFIEAKKRSAVPTS